VLKPPFDRKVSKRNWLRSCAKNQGVTTVGDYRQTWERMVPGGVVKKAGILRDAWGVDISPWVVIDAALSMGVWSNGPEKARRPSLTAAKTATRA